MFHIIVIDPLGSQYVDPWLSEASISFCPFLVCFIPPTKKHTVGECLIFYCSLAQVKFPTNNPKVDVSPFSLLEPSSVREPSQEGEWDHSLLTLCVHMCVYRVCLWRSEVSPKVHSFFRCCPPYFETRCSCWPEAHPLGEAGWWAPGMLLSARPSTEIMSMCHHLWHFSHRSKESDAGPMLAWQVL